MDTHPVLIKYVIIHRVEVYLPAFLSVCVAYTSHIPPPPPPIYTGWNSSQYLLPRKMAAPGLVAILCRIKLSFFSHSGWSMIIIRSYPTSCFNKKRDLCQQTWCNSPVLPVHIYWPLVQENKKKIFKVYLCKWCPSNRGIHRLFGELKHSSESMDFWALSIVYYSKN
jgi:hypothetical protein